MKASYYNYLINNGDNYILYNTFSDEIILMRPEIHSIYVENINCIDKIRKIHPSFYNCLLSKRAIVEDNENEADSFVKNWYFRERSTKVFTFTINPTLNCNMRCWYCYETKKRMIMADSVIQRIIAAVESKCKDTQYEKIVFSFLGGEPLLTLDKVIKPIIKRVGEICTLHDKEFLLHFTTNGYLINNKLFDIIEGIPTSFQIPLDGNAYVHNKTKTIRGVDGTYHRTIENIKSCLKKGLSITVRLNFTRSTLPFFIDIIDDFSDLNSSERQLLKFNFQRVWQDDVTNDDFDLISSIRNIERNFMESGLSVSPYTSNHFGICYADDRNSIVVNYDGNLFNCTARDFTEEYSEGNLDMQGNFIWNERYDERRNLVVGGKTCKKCKVFPLCHGGCSQFKKENAYKINSCIKNLTEDDKTRMVQNRVYDIITLSNLTVR